MAVRRPRLLCILLGLVLDVENIVFNVENDVFDEKRRFNVENDVFDVGHRVFDKYSTQAVYGRTCKL